MNVIQWNDIPIARLIRIGFVWFTLGQNFWFPGGPAEECPNCGSAKNENRETNAILPNLRAITKF